MKKILLRSFGSLIATLSLVVLTSCRKSSGGSDTDSPTETHFVDPRLVGTWQWTSAGDASWYDNNGVYTGPSYGMAQRYQIKADGSGSSFSHIFSNLGPGSSLEVNISSTGFYESDDKGHFGYFPLKGQYKSSSGENRALNSSEVYNEKDASGKVYLFQKLEFKTIDGRQCFEVTSSNNITDRYYKIN